MRCLILIRLAFNIRNITNLSIFCIFHFYIVELLLVLIRIRVSWVGTVSYNIHITNFCVANLYFTCTRRHLNQGRLAYCLYINCKHCPCGNKFNTTTLLICIFKPFYYEEMELRVMNNVSQLKANFKVLVDCLYECSLCLVVAWLCVVFVCPNFHYVWLSCICVYYLFALIFIMSGCRVFVYTICLP